MQMETLYNSTSKFPLEKARLKITLEHLHFQSAVTVTPTYFKTSDND